MFNCTVHYTLWSKDIILEAIAKVMVYVLYVISQRKIGSSFAVLNSQIFSGSNRISFHAPMILCANKSAHYKKEGPVCSLLLVKVIAY
jgi:hypothetical protein